VADKTAGVVTFGHLGSSAANHQILIRGARFVKAGAGRTGFDPRSPQVPSPPGTVQGVTSVAILGAGAVGVACAGPLLQLGLASELALFDRDGDKARGEALDFHHAAPLLPECTVEGGSIDSIRTADIAVLTTGVHTQPGQTRLDTLDHNLAVAIDVADALEEALPRVVVVVSNPVDVLTEYLTRRWESRPVRVFGTGTSLDSWRLRELLAVELGVHPGNIHAWVIGEHGDSAVFPFESARVGPFSLAEFGHLSGRPLAAERLGEIEQEVRARRTRFEP
jgi:L-lactate dehydrogenase